MLQSFIFAMMAAGAKQLAEKLRRVFPKPVRTLGRNPSEVKYDGGGGSQTRQTIENTEVVDSRKG
jgi:hypothetical protein